MMRRIYSIKSVVIGLIIANVVIFLFSEYVKIPLPSMLLTSLASKGGRGVADVFRMNGLLVTLFGLSPFLIIKYGFVWQVFSYMFLHGSFIHIFFNMYALLLFGRPLEQRWGQSRFLSFYLFTGVGAGVITFIWKLSGWLLFGNPGSMATASMVIPTIGASGAIFGILLAFSLEFPDVMLLLFFFIPVRARYATFIFGGLQLVFLIFGRSSGVAHFTHLAGILFGYIYYVWRIKSRYRVGASTGALKQRMQAFRARAAESLSDRGTERAIHLADEVKLKIESDVKLTQEEENFLDKLRQSYNQHGSEMCRPDEFNPRASDCLKCKSLLACLYRYVLDIQ
jgi:membrane associated rhomboid family serine protease